MRLPAVSYGIGKQVIQHAFHLLFIKKDRELSSLTCEFEFHLVLSGLLLIREQVLSDKPF